MGVYDKDVDFQGSDVLADNFGIRTNGRAQKLEAGSEFNWGGFIIRGSSGGIDIICGYVGFNL